MMSPTFECSPDGLRSAVRLRYVVWGNPDPERQAEIYMSGYRISEPMWQEPELLRRRIAKIIEDIERATLSFSSPEEMARVQAAVAEQMRAHFEVPTPTFS